MEKFNLQKKIVLISALLYAVSMIIFVIFFTVNLYIREKNNKIASLENSLKQIDLNLKTNFNDINNLSFSVIGMDVMENWRNGETTSDLTLVNELKGQINTNLLFNSAWNNKLVDSIYLYKNKTANYLASRSMTPIYIEQQNINNLFVEQEISSQFYSFIFAFDNVGNPSLYSMRTVRNNAFNEHITFIYKINYEVFFNSLDYLDLDSNVAITINNDIVYSKKPADVDTPYYISTLADGINYSIKDNSVIFSKIIMDKIKIEYTTPLSSLGMAVLSNIAPSILIAIVLITILIIALASLVAHLTRFLNDFNKNIDSIRRKKYDVSFPNYKDSDLNQIASTFSSMSQELKNLINKEYKNQLLLKDADIKLLQNQINPHFLVNSLATISTSALLAQQTEIYTMISSLTTILNYSLRNSLQDSSYVTIKDELEYINCYLTLQKFRFDNTSYKINVSNDKLYSMKIPRLTIEPLVENAFNHGIKNLKGGHIDINISIKDDLIVTEIVDNGGKLFNSLKDDSQNHGIALKNINKRMKLLFGSGHDVIYSCEENKNTTAIIKFPIQID